MNNRLYWAVGIGLILTLIQVVANETLLLKFLNIPAILLTAIYLSKQWRNSSYLLLCLTSLGQAFWQGVNLGSYALAAAVILIMLYFIEQYKLDRFPYAQYFWVIVAVLGYLIVCQMLLQWPQFSLNWGLYLPVIVVTVILAQLLSLWLRSNELNYTVKV